LGWWVFFFFFFSLWGLAACLLGLPDVDGRERELTRPNGA
jgi:hypothetical protein